MNLYIIGLHYASSNLNVGKIGSHPFPSHKKGNFSAYTTIFSCYFYLFFTAIQYKDLSINSSEKELVGSHVVGEGESGSDVLSEQFDLLDVSQKGRVNGLLGLLLFSDSLLFFFRELLTFLGKESFFALLLGLDLSLGEIFVVDAFSIDTSKTDFI